MAVLAAGVSAFAFPAAAVAHHGPATGHLPPAQQNMTLVGEVELTEAFGDVQPEQIADVTVLKNHAYASSWHIKAPDEQQCRGGMYVVDLSDPTKPDEIAFRAAAPGAYYTEGMHAISASTPSFSGDILVASAEHQRGETNPACTFGPETTGGIDLWDVTNPANPTILSMGTGDTGTTANNADGRPHESHSAALWQHNGKLYVVAADNEEIGLFGPNRGDVDVFDATDPRAPVQIGDWNMEVMFPQTMSNNGYGANPSIHDIWVQHVNGVPIMIVSYWDGGYILLDVSDPTNPTYVADTDFGGTDPLFPQFGLQNGNAHQAELSWDRRFLLAADEDFSPFRLQLRITSGQFANQDVSVSTGNIAAVQLQDGETVSGPTVFIGRACTQTTSDTVPAAPTADTIAVSIRGDCNFTEKAAAAENAGYNTIIIMNTAVASSSPCQRLINMNFTGYAGDINALFVGHEDGLKILNARPNDYKCTPNDNNNTSQPPAKGTSGSTVTASSGEFDGWGYTHLYRMGTGKLQAIDHFAIPESMDESKASGFGDLSVHEFATDPQENLAYSSYYSGGMRVLTFGDAGLENTGTYIDDSGSNFWGVEHATIANRRLIVGSDRDYGVQVFEYTGPGAAKPPTCQNITVNTEFRTPVNIPLTCTDVNGQTLTFALLGLSSKGGTITLNGNVATYTPATSFAGTDSFTYRASDGMLISGPATVTVNVALPKPGTVFFEIPCNPAGETIIGTPADDLIRCGPGNDILDGRAGDDALFGEAGNDRLLGGEGDDFLEGGTGNDVGDGGEDNDTLAGNAGNDTLAGADGHDTIDGGTGRNSLSGGSGHDSIEGGTSADRMIGGSGDDELIGGRGGDRITPGKGEDDVDAGPGNDRISARDGRVDIINCGSGRRDRATVDRADLTQGCERVIRPKRKRRR